MEEHEDDLEQVANFLRTKPPKPLPVDFANQILEKALDGENDSVTDLTGKRWIRHLYDALFLPRSLSIRPVWQFAMAIALCVSSALVTMWGMGYPAGNSGVSDVAWVRFATRLPDAKRVSLVGDFNAWGEKELQLSKSDDSGVWHVLVPLKPGVYQYMFVIDNKEWVSDPVGVRVEDGFGRENSLIRVGKIL